jgi:hypothetical protein
MSAFDVELGEGTRQGGVGGSDFFVGEFVAETGFGASTGFFDFGFVDVVGGDGHVSEDVDVVRGNLDEAFANSEGVFLRLLADDDFAWNHLSQEWDVLGIDAELAFDTGESHHVGVFGEGGAVGRYYLELHSLISEMPPFI